MSGFDKFSDRARQALRLAQGEARRLNHNYIGTEHLLLGLLGEGRGLAAQSLVEMGIRLDKVREAVDGETLRPGYAYVAPGNFHMEVRVAEDGYDVAISQGPLVNSCRPSVDVLFASVARCFGANALGVVLAGMGQDGLKGCEQLFTRGGRVLVQDRASSVVWGMPGHVAAANLADLVLPIGELGDEVVTRVKESRQ